MIYLFPVHAVVVLKGPTKSNPHFWSGSNGCTGWWGICAFSMGWPTLLHKPHSRQHGIEYFKVVGHHTPLLQIFLVVASPAVSANYSTMSFSYSSPSWLCIIHHEHPWVTHDTSMPPRTYMQPCIAFHSMFKKAFSKSYNNYRRFFRHQWHVPLFHVPLFALANHTTFVRYPSHIYDNL